MNGNYTSWAGSNVGDKMLFSCEFGYIISDTWAPKSSTEVACVMEQDGLTAQWDEQPTCEGKFGGSIA
jgi:hypothetical protein